MNPSVVVPAANPVLAHVVRSGFIEGQHRGSLVVLAADGSVELALGEPEADLFPRSSNKPMQAAAALRCGLDLDDQLLALAAASHSGEPFHLDGVRKILARAGLTPDALRTPPDLPVNRQQADQRIREGLGPEPLTMNCSGKHAAMLATCMVNGWSIDDYLQPDHPLQREILRGIEAATGDLVRYVGVDGCGAPLMSTTLVGLARAFRCYVLAEPGSVERRVADAMRGHPEFVGGTNRHDTQLMANVPGALSKAGAEAVQAVALDDGRALAFKIEDGASRAVGPVLAAALRRMGVAHPVLDTIAHSPVNGGGAPVGEVRAAL